MKILSNTANGSSEFPKFLTCDAIPKLAKIRYGFFTNRGGVSSGPYASLNVGPGSNDVPENVIENRRRAMQCFANKNENDLCTLYQVHGNHVVKVTAPFQQGERPEGDAMVTNQEGVVLGILTADCGPILFADEKEKVIGAAHAGWKGAAYGVLENTIEAMEELGAVRSNITAFIGPCIHQSSYEVGEEFYQNFINLSKENDTFFVPSAKRDEHYQFDLPNFIDTRLRMQKLKHIEQLKLDTCAEKERFFSYRRQTLLGIKEYGRGLSVIMIEE